MKKPNIRAKRAATKAKGGRRGTGGGRPPKHYAYDPKSIPGLRDQARARAATSMGDVVELWELMVGAGLHALRELNLQGAPRPDTGATSKAGLGSKRVDVSRDGEGDSWTSETREEFLPYAGLDWGAVNRAAENLADRCGFARKTEMDLGVDSTRKLFRLDTYRGKDGVRHDVPGHTAGDPAGS